MNRFLVLSLSLLISFSAAAFPIFPRAATQLPAQLLANCHVVNPSLDVTDVYLEVTSPSTGNLYAQQNLRPTKPALFGSSPFLVFPNVSVLFAGPLVTVTASLMTVSGPFPLNLTLPRNQTTTVQVLPGQPAVCVVR